MTRGLSGEAGEMRIQPARPPQPPPAHQPRPRPDLLPRLLPDRFAACPVTLADHLARYGPLPRCAGRGRDRADLLAEVELAGLAGRGGAGFPTARKLAAVAAGRNPVVIANGTEGEPASAKDKVLMAQSPHLVLDGAVAAADLVGASEAVIVAHPAVSDIVTAAAAERHGNGCSPVTLTVLPGADRFVAGEASAVVHWVSSGIPAPTYQRHRLSERGLNGRPTLVQNVETLAHLALIVRFGAGWFQGVGIGSESGSMLVTLTGAVWDPGVYETAIGTPLAAVLDLGGGPTQALGSLLIGGYFGTWLQAGHALGLPLCSAGLRSAGAGLGAGLIAALPADVCPLAETARIARYLAAESAGQCGPCVFGLDSLAWQLELLAVGGAADPALLQRWICQLRSGRGACKHPDGAVGMIASALRTFPDEVDAHLEGWCTGRPADRSGYLPVPSWSQR
jgi:NADH:ubiquinone oxidoreductase subunit F (NADH-binding)